MKLLKQFIQQETVLTAAAVLAVVSAFFVPPDAQYLGYIDLRTLAILFSLMTVMAGLRRQGFFDGLGRALLSRTHSTFQLTLVLVGLCFFGSMFITNDVSLLTFVPFTFVVLSRLGADVRRSLLIPVICMQTIAANLGSMLTPIGNPQNLYLYGKSGMSIEGFVLLMLPYTLVSLLLLLAWQALGRGFLVRTAVCTVTSSLFLSLVPPPAAPLVEETLTNCVLGGILVGFSLGIVLTCGCSTGGLDILGLWLAKKGKGFSVGRFSLSFNALLYTLCAVLFGLRAAIYSIIYTVFCALFIDRGHQQNITEQVLIFTKDEDPELPRNIMARLGRGVTYWEGKGAYTGEDLRVLCVCVSKFEEADLYGVVHELDPNAFFITQEGVTIHGNFIRKLS